MNKLIKTAMAAALAFTGHIAAAQDEIDWDNLSLEELMTIPINSASKKDETLFDAPLSSYTITRSDIANAGSVTIMEALRLAPGIIVREQANGSYDIHIRGFDNLLRGSETTTKANLATLVMIDNRPVFNNNLGGTFWEALPIDLNDVERIEVVRGPSAPLFGPNAVTGVINIITRKVEKDKTLVNATVQGGSASTVAAGVNAGKSFGKFGVMVSGNYQQRERFQTTYFVPATGKYQSVDEIAAIFGETTYQQYQDPAHALTRYGMNLALDYKVSEKTDFRISAGRQESEVQRVFLSNVLKRSIPFTTSESETNFVNATGRIHGFSFRTSLLKGRDDLAVNASPNQYDYTVVDATAEYTIQAGKLGTVVPGVTYHHAIFNDEDYVSEGLTFLGGREQDILTTSAFIRTDLHPLKALRVLAALRMDKFSAPDDAYLAYELAATYKLNRKNLIRAAVTRSNSGSFIGYNYLNLEVPLPANLSIVRTGSTDLDLYTINMVEVGYRSQLSPSFQLDLDAFHQRVENLVALQTTNGVDPGNGTFVATQQQFRNVPTTATQVGFTFGVNYVPNDKLHIKPFVTFQKTETQDLPSAYVAPELAAALGTTVAYTNSRHRNTPPVYGGYYINYKITGELTINVNGYFFGNHRQYDQYDPAATSDTGDIKGKVLMNSKVSYRLKKVDFFINARNVLNSTSREFYGGDDAGRLLLAGASVSL